jgi:excinuclease ABC subunit C
MSTQLERARPPACCARPARDVEHDKAAGWRYASTPDGAGMDRPTYDDIPPKPGCYQFVAGDGSYLYVGKAVNLRRRIPAYFRTTDRRLCEMVKSAERVEWVVCGNETEALVLEAALVSRHRPRYNIRLQDRHPYPYLALRDDGRRPVRLLRWRDTPSRGVKVFGPYPQRDVIDALEQAAQELYGIRSCRDAIYDRAVRERRPCLLAEIGRCSAPCVDVAGSEVHARQVAAMAVVLQGDIGAAQQRATDKMEAAAQAREYERAAKYRDLHAALGGARERQRVNVPAGQDFDVLGVTVQGGRAACQVLWVRGGAVIAGKAVVVDGTDDCGAVIDAVASQIYTSRPDSGKVQTVPQQILMSADGPWVNGLVEAHYARPVKVRVPRRGWARQLLELAEQNAVDILERETFRRDADPARRSAALRALGDALGIDAPWRIECFDISHTQGVEVVAGMSVLEDGLPVTSQYRHFVIRTVAGQDDYASMREVVKRRYLNATTTPDLVLIDGGPGQLAAAGEALRDVDVDLPVAALAKKLEEVWLPDDDVPVVLPRDSDGLLVLQRARDEAHRFAGRLHRKRRSVRMLAGPLENLGIKGLGPKRTAALHEAFPGDALRDATVEQLAAVIPERLAIAVHGVLRRGSASGEG